MSDLDRRLGQLAAARPALGLSLAVVRGAEVVFCRGVGVRDGGPVTPTTAFEAGSLTKPLFAYAVLKLVEAGALDLDRPLAAYLPQPYGDAPCLARITARHALSHTSGLPNWRAPTGLACAFAPGTGFSYSGEGYLYLQTVVERITGRPLHEFLARALFAPLGIRDSEMMLEEWSARRPELPAGRRAYAAASLKTTALDYARFLSAMWRDQDNTPSALKPESLTAMLTPQITVGEQAGLAWGLGWGLADLADGTSSFWQWGGWWDVTRNFALGSPARQEAVVILTNDLAGLALCAEIAGLALAGAADYPAFRWLLPPERWRADGRRPERENTDA